MPVIVHLSDLHFGAHVEALAESLLTDVATQQPDLVVVSGDLTQRARPGEFERAREFLDRMPGPVLTVPAVVADPALREIHHCGVGPGCAPARSGCRRP
jgi:Calcineurin-like phosphoesterase